MRKITLVMCDVVSPVMDELIKDGFIDIIGKEHVFETVHDVTEAYKNTNFSDAKTHDQATSHALLRCLIHPINEVI